MFEQAERNSLGRQLATWSDVGISQNEPNGIPNRIPRSLRVTLEASSCEVFFVHYAFWVCIRFLPQT